MNFDIHSATLCIIQLCFFLPEPPDPNSLGVWNVERHDESKTTFFFSFLMLTEY